MRVLRFLGIVNHFLFLEGYVGHPAQITSRYYHFSPGGDGTGDVARPVRVVRVGGAHDGPSVQGWAGGVYRYNCSGGGGRMRFFSFSSARGGGGSDRGWPGVGGVGRDVEDEPGHVSQHVGHEVFLHDGGGRLGRGSPFAVLFLIRGGSVLHSWFTRAGGLSHQVLLFLVILCHRQDDLPLQPLLVSG